MVSGFSDAPLWAGAKHSGKGPSVNVSTSMGNASTITGMSASTRNSGGGGGFGVQGVGNPQIDSEIKGFYKALGKM